MGICPDNLSCWDHVIKNSTIIVKEKVKKRKRSVNMKSLRITLALTCLVSWLLAYTVNATSEDTKIRADPDEVISILQQSNKLLEARQDLLLENEDTSLTVDPFGTLLIISSLDGKLTAVDRGSGKIRWSTDGYPMIRVLTGRYGSSTTPYFIPDPKSGALYVMGKKNQLRKLPFTIPELVGMAPCKNSEGLMYTGKKSDVWVSFNAFTGESKEINPIDDYTCPVSSNNGEKNKATNSAAYTLHRSFRNIIVGKTEYVLSMIDGPRKWNLTYNTFASAEMGREQAEQYEYIHFSSPSSGQILTYDRSTAKLQWQLDLGSPALAFYKIDGSSNFVSIPFSTIATDTMNRLKSDTSSSMKNKLIPTTYVGEFKHGLYAVSALVDDDVLLIESESVPLIEGPAPENSSVTAPQTLPTNNTDFLLLGHYAEETNVVPQVIDGKDRDSENITKVPEDTHDTTIQSGTDSNPSKRKIPPVTPNVIFPALMHFSSPAMTKKIDSKPFKIVFTTAALSVLFTVISILMGYFVYSWYQTGVNVTSKKVAAASAASDGATTIGKIKLDPNHILGKGCDGTFVFKGSFDGREVAVKRILPECFIFADREVDLLRESDQHHNVIRYYCTETDGQFRYIALELCLATICDWVEGRLEPGVSKTDLMSDMIDPIKVLNEATAGLAHLHSLRIVHRDIKPANVLLTLSSSSGLVRAVISDFGLCKKLSQDKNSFSRRSGSLPGTEGWVAPEILKNFKNEGKSTPERMTYSVDIFSLGCLFYYIMTKGEHPFGSHFDRQANIIKGECNLTSLSEHPQGMNDLVHSMIKPNPVSRPPLEAVLKHPSFWTKQKILNFFLDVSDRIEKETERTSHLVQILEKDAEIVVKDDWRNHICADVAMDLRKYRTYKGHSVRDLLRALRNKKNHYRELSKEAQESLGHIPNKFVDYWTSRFPRLLPHTYSKFEIEKMDPVFSEYYCRGHDFFVIPEAEEERNEENSTDDSATFDLISIQDGVHQLANSKPTPEITPSTISASKNFWKSRNQLKSYKWKRRNNGETKNNSQYTDWRRPRDSNSRSPMRNNGQNNHYSHALGEASLDDNWRKHKN